MKDILTLIAAQNESITSLNKAVDYLTNIVRRQQIINDNTAGTFQEMGRCFDELKERVNKLEDRISKLEMNSIDSL